MRRIKNVSKQVEGKTAIAETFVEIKKGEFMIVQPHLIRATNEVQQEKVEDNFAQLQEKQPELLMPTDLRKLLKEKLLQQVESGNIRRVPVIVSENEESWYIYCVEDALKVALGSKRVYSVGAVAKTLCNWNRPKGKRFSTQTSALEHLASDRSLMRSMKFPKPRSNWRKERSAGAEIDLLVDLVWCLLVPHRATRKRIEFQNKVAELLIQSF